MNETETQLAFKTDNLPNRPVAFWFLIILAMLLMAAAIAFFGRYADYGLVVSETPSSTSEKSRESRIYIVYHQGGVFSPTNIRIRAGDTVRFKNNGFSPIRIVSDPHPAHDDLAGFDSMGDILPDGIFTFTFSAKGTFGYHNEKNSNQRGTIIVK